ncbi:MAG TPA: fluoride efflux transporter CrcB [Chitinophagales bacterium]|nr:fluoride efflux transporter CrcB [Chitinophagales bacterium]
MTRIVLIIGIGGFIGTIARYLSQQVIYRFYPATFPIGTLSVNLLGCLLIGIFYALSERGNLLSPEWRMFLTTGFCGGFTTFSTFSYESVQLLNDGEYTYVAVFAVASVIIGILATIFGIWISKTILA